MVCICAQRLLRRLCNCKQEDKPKPEEALLLNRAKNTEAPVEKIWRPVGCPHCSGSGYKGRRGLYELLDITDPIRDLITQKAPTLVIRSKAIELGMTTLREDGLRNIYDGATTIEEVLKYT